MRAPRRRRRPGLAKVQAEHGTRITSDAPRGAKQSGPRLRPARRAGETGPTAESVVIFSLRKLCPLNSREGKVADGELGYYHEHPGRAWVAAGRANRTGCGRSRAPRTRRCDTPVFRVSPTCCICGVFSASLRCTAERETPPSGQDTTNRFYLFHFALDGSCSPVARLRRAALWGVTGLASGSPGGGIFKALAALQIR